MFSKKGLPLAFCSTAFLTACFTPDSIDLPTNEMMPNIVVKTDKDATYVNAVLWHNKFAALYELSDGEKFSATLAGNTKTLTEKDTESYFNGSNYSLTITTPGNSEKSFSTKFEGNFEEQTIEVTLDRAGNNIDTVSSVTIPLPSEITSPVDGSTALPDQSIDIAWSPSGLSDKVTLHFQSNCETFSGQIKQSPNSGLFAIPITNKYRRFTVSAPDTGVYSASILDVLELSGYYQHEEPVNSGDIGNFVDVAINCPVNIYITRKNVGTLDTELKFGSIVAENTRSAIGAFKVNANWKNYTYITE